MKERLKDILSWVSVGLEKNLSVIIFYGVLIGAGELYRSGHKFLGIVQGVLMFLYAVDNYNRKDRE